MRARAHILLIVWLCVFRARLRRNTVQQCSGNCYSLGGGVGLLMENSVFLRDMSTRLFMYGTTDIIVGGLRGGGLQPFPRLRPSPPVPAPLSTSELV